MNACISKLLSVETMHLPLLLIPPPPFFNAAIRIYSAYHTQLHKSVSRVGSIQGNNHTCAVVYSLYLEDGQCRQGSRPISEPKKPPYAFYSLLNLRIAQYPSSSSAGTIDTTDTKTNVLVLFIIIVAANRKKLVRT